MCLLLLPLAAGLPETFGGKVSNEEDSRYFKEDHASGDLCSEPPGLRAPRLSESARNAAL